MMTKRNVMIHISTERRQLAMSLFDEEADDELPPEELDVDGEECDEPTEMLVEGRLITGPGRVELVYDEGEFSGMEGSVTSIGFDRSAPGLISMLRSGPVSTGMVFEEGRRHLSVYETPFSNFQICVRSLHVENALLTEGRILLEYLIEVHGAQAERCRMLITVKQDEALFPSASPFQA